jgi:hypothetical protein
MLLRQKQPEVPEQDWMADLQTKGCVHVRLGGGTHDVTVEETVVVAVVHIVVVVAHVGRFKRLQAEEIVCKRCLAKGLLHTFDIQRARLSLEESCPLPSSAILLTS